jgi:hypothetical protein
MQPLRLAIFGVFVLPSALSEGLVWILDKFDEFREKGRGD